MFSALSNTKKQLADIFNGDVDPLTPPHYLPKLDVQTIKVMILSASKDQLNIRNTQGFTYLQVAIAYAKRLPEFIEVVAALLKQGADPNLLAIDVKETKAPKHIQKDRKHTHDFSALDFVVNIKTHIPDTDEKLSTLLNTYGAKLKKTATIKKLSVVDGVEVKAEIKQTESKNDQVNGYVGLTDDLKIHSKERESHRYYEALLFEAATDMISAIDNIDSVLYVLKYQDAYELMMQVLNKVEGWSKMDVGSGNIFQFICGNIHLICNHLNKVSKKDMEQKNDNHAKFQFFKFFLESKLDGATQLQLKSCLEAVEIRENRLYERDTDYNALQLFLEHYTHADDDLYFNMFEDLLALYRKVGADLYPKACGAMSPLMLAARVDDQRLVDALIKAGVDVNETRADDVPNAAVYADLCGHYAVANLIKHHMFTPKTKKYKEDVLNQLPPYLQGYFHQDAFKLFFEMTNSRLICDIFKMNIIYKRKIGMGTGGGSPFHDIKWRENYTSKEAINEIEQMGEANVFVSDNFIYTLKCYFTLLYVESEREFHQFNIKSAVPQKEAKVNNEIDAIQQLKLKMKEMLIRLKQSRDCCTVDVYLMDVNQLSFDEVIKRVYQKIKSVVSDFEIVEDPAFVKGDSFQYPKIKTKLEDVTDSLEVMLGHFETLFPNLLAKATNKL